MGRLRPLTCIPSSIPTISPLVVSITTGSATRQDMVSYHQINYADGMYTNDAKAHGLASRVTTISSMTRPRLLRSIGSLQMAMTAGPTSSAGGLYRETDLEVLMLHLLAPSKASLSPSHGTEGPTQWDCADTGDTFCDSVVTCSETNVPVGAMTLTAFANIHMVSQLLDCGQFMC